MSSTSLKNGTLYRDTTAHSIPGMFDSRVSVNLGGGADQTLTGITTLQFDTVVYDNPNHWEIVEFDTSAYKFEPFVSGYYNIKFTCKLVGITYSSTSYIYIYKDGTDYILNRWYEQRNAAGNDKSMTLSTDIYLTSSDFIDFRAASTGDVSSDIRDTFVMIHRIA